MKLALHWQILIAIVVGIIFGIWFYQYTGYVSWMGTLFLRLLNMLVIPLIFSSIVSAIANLPNGEALKRMGFRTIGFYAGTTLIAILTGLFLVSMIQPGIGLELPRDPDEYTAVQDTSAKITNTNPVFVDKTSVDKKAVDKTAVNTNLVEDEKLQKIKGAQKPFNELLLNIVPNNVVEDMAKGNILPVIFFAFLSGALIHSIPPSNAQTLRELFRSIFELMMQMTLFVVRLAPFGVFGLIAAQCGLYAGDPDKLIQAASSLGLFMGTSLFGMAFHFFVTMSIVLVVFAKVNPFRHMYYMFPTLATAFSTATSNATVPLSIDCLERKWGISRQTSGFVVPLGATLNMNGTALYECVIVMFLSQAYGIPLTLGDQIVMIVLVMLSAAGTAGIPMASFVMTAIACRAVGLPLAGLGVILAIDRILDMSRTTVNVYGDTCCAVYIARAEGELQN